MKQLCLCLAALVPTFFGCSGQEPTADDVRVSKPVSDDAESNTNVGESVARPDGQTGPVSRVSQPVPTIRRWYTATRLSDDKGVREFEIAEDSRQQGYVFLVVEALVPGQFLWQKAGDSFYSAPAQTCTVIGPKGTLAVAEAWTTDPESPFSKTPKTAFMPEPPSEDEPMIFAFAIDQSHVDVGGLSFHYGDLPAVPLSDELRVVEE